MSKDKTVLGVSLDPNTLVLWDTTTASLVPGSWFGNTWAIDESQRPLEHRHSAQVWIRLIDLAWRHQVRIARAIRERDNLPLTPMEEVMCSMAGGDQ